MKNLFVILSCCISFIILGCSDFKSASTPQTEGPAAKLKNGDDLEAQDHSKNKDDDINIQETDIDLEKIRQDREKLLIKYQSLSDTDKREHITPNKVQACMYYTYNKDLIRKDRNLATNLQQDFDKTLSLKIQTYHHRCNKAQYKVSFNNEIHDQVLNLNNEVITGNNTRSSRPVYGLKNTSKAYQVPFTVDQAILNKNRNEAPIFLDDNLHTIIDVPGTLFTGLSWKDDKMMDIDFQCNVFKTDGTTDCQHSDSAFVQVALIGTAVIEIDGVKHSYYVRTSNISAKPDNSTPTSIDLVDMDVTLDKPEFDDWCNPYIGKNDPWTQPDNDLVTIQNWSDETKREHIGKIDKTDVCMSYLHGFEANGVKTVDHYCNKTRYNVFFNDKQISASDSPLNLNNQLLTNNKQREVKGISSTSKNPVNYLVPGTTDKVALYRTNRYGVYREDNWLRKVVDVPGTVFSTTSKIKWDDDLKLKVSYKCSGSCAHTGSTTKQIIDQSMKGKVYVALNGVSIPYYIRDDLKVTSADLGLTYDMKDLTFNRTDASFDDWCRVIPTDEKSKIDDEDNVKIEANKQAQPDFQAIYDDVNSKDESTLLTKTSITSTHKAQICLAYLYKKKSNKIDTSHTCNEDLFDFVVNNEKKGDLNFNNGTNQLVNGVKVKQREVEGIHSGDIYEVPSVTSNAGQTLRNDGKHTAADIPGVLFKDLTWKNNKLLNIDAHCYHEDPSDDSPCRHAIGGTVTKPIVAFSLISPVDIAYSYNNKTWYLPDYYITTNEIKHIFPHVVNTIDTKSSTSITRDYLTPAAQTFNRNDLHLLYNVVPTFDDWCEIIIPQP